LKVLETYEGASGKITLNKYGDRAGSDYAIFAPVTIAGKVEWRMVELYDFGKNTIVKVEKDPFAEKPATLPTTLPKFSPPPKPTTPTPTPAPGVSPALIAVIVIVIVAVAAIAYYILRR